MKLITKRITWATAAITLAAAGIIVAQNAAVFPGRTVTTADLFVASNYASTTLLIGVNATATSATVASGSGFVAPQLVTIDNEIVNVCQVAGNTLTFGKSSCPNVDGRGYDGTAAASHVATRPVQGRVVAWLHNQLAAEMIAIENKLHLELISVVDFGADPTGAFDSEPAFATAYASVASGGGTLHIPCGTYLFNSTLTLTSSALVRLVGQGGCTRLTWGGNNASPMLLVNNCLQCELRDFQVTGSATHQLLYAIQTKNTGAGNTPTMDRMVNINIEGVAGYITTGILFGGGVDGNNDQQYLESVVVRNYSHSGFTLNNTQVYDVVFHHCGFASDGFGAYGVEALSGNFHWDKGDGGGNTTADFYWGGGGSFNSDITGGRFESSKKFLVTAGPAYNYATVSLRNISFSGDCLGDGSANIKAGTCARPGGDAITWQFAGVLNITDSIFGTGLGSPVTTPLTITMTNFGVGFPTIAALTNVVIASSATTLGTIFPQAQPTAVTNSYQYDNNLTYTKLQLPNLAPYVFNLSSSSETTVLDAATTGLTTTGFGTALRTLTNSGPESNLFASQRTNSTYTDFWQIHRYTGGLSNAPAFEWVAAGPFGGLATCGTTAPEGSVAGVTDSNTNTWGAAIAGGGANHVRAYCDGTNWTVIGK